ncbi:MULTISPECIES: hypothetical protein [Streptomyces]|uniref:Secreted protein n=1 Tax=Streptomyces morookaense TaxID=1970 RepID=A0A7Y7BAG3_STRMO|nr:MULTISPECIES: hypothetical protein [Streptomyces]MCC2276692.1 hypothetical protein [Streptomyces sp. ET3-23]NVK81966.1 hypothetical protein [Streptomyces morookaense]
MNARRYAVASAALGLAAGLFAAAPASAAAAATPSAQGSSGDVEFSVFDNGSGIPRNSSFRLADLGRHGVPESAVKQLGAGKAPRTAGADAESHVMSGPDDLVGQWKDRDGWTVYLRRGYYDPARDRGFGLTKIEQKHNLTMKAVRATTQYPRPGAAGKQQMNGRPNTYNYFTDVLHVKCSGWWIFKTCRVDKVQAVRAGVDFGAQIPMLPKGVITAYCEGVQGRCPDWVKNAINI